MPYDAAGELLTIATYDGRTPRPLFLIDPRSIGKIVVIKQISETARRNSDWTTFHIDVTPRNLIATLITQLKVVEEPPSRRVSLACDENVLTTTLCDQLRTTVESAERQVVGLLVSLDNQHHTTSSEMDELGSILQEIAPENRPLVVMMSALPRSWGGRPRWQPARLP
ncbi:hypothetical protein [Corynebacterium sp. CNJ-954]|uniref:hypothetical protein n=1 Tax=Corynebacterium sp. CNJ-954 TaxID=1904962 RepID=UPI001115313E|nr:hypothetical protein [Corynebacterium sp. CNJ-954]